MIIDYPCYTPKCSVVSVQEQSVRIVDSYMHGDMVQCLIEKFRWLLLCKFDMRIVVL